MKTRAKQLYSLLLFGALSITACNTTSEAENKPLPALKAAQKKPRIGEQRDAHGCVTTAGYVWSAAKDSCIRLWESGSVLEPTGRSELIVYAVESDDKMKAEIFIPDYSTIILLGDGRGNYRKDSLILTANGSKYALQMNGKTIYQTATAASAEDVSAKKKRRRR